MYLPLRQIQVRRRQNTAPVAEKLVVVHLQTYRHTYTHEVCELTIIYTYTHEVCELTIICTYTHEVCELTIIYTYTHVCITYMHT